MRDNPFRRTVFINQIEPAEKGGSAFPVPGIGQLGSDRVLAAAYERGHVIGPVSHPLGIPALARGKPVISDSLAIEIEITHTEGGGIEFGLPDLLTGSRRELATQQFGAAVTGIDGFDHLLLSLVDHDNVVLIGILVAVAGKPDAGQTFETAVLSRAGEQGTTPALPSGVDPVAGVCDIRPGIGDKTDGTQMRESIDIRSCAGR